MRRITPLNVVSAILLVCLIGNLSYKGQQFMLISCLVLATLSDLFFRALIRRLKRLWTIELIFIGLVCIFMALIGKFH